ncbi:TRAP transporter, DctM subunit [Tistlia consotensis]|uniref:TRAP transporter large permease protein n=1 Tax=Tistlia consotensis USBA 355 TaxID=560819 RepID=A0A1Y6CNB1_9PROT|nr:TRAP transporter large permease subunit [Tistlia consotensis]SMF64755.1 TRAP transporter, DctM subunit [Tistlia consotensis USBA 355]SNR96723.1 TRAP transporter, DctM subunit [Tistlia consotensis]
MSELPLIALFVFSLFFLLGSGVWVGSSLLVCAFIGMELFTHRPVGDSMAITIWSSQSSWTLTALPMFVWMGEILFRSRLSEVLFRGLTPWLQYLPGGLLHVNIAGCAIFAAISGSSAATVATVGKMSVPELRKRGYPERMNIGTLAGAGTLGLLIPPSISMIIYGVTVNESIARLFIAGILPGICLALLFMTYVVVWDLVSGKTKREYIRFTARERLRSLLDLLPVLGLILAVILSIYTGFATATEAAVLGVVGSLALSAIQRSLTWETFRESLLGAVRTSAMIAFILMGSSFLSLAMGFTGIPAALAEGIGALHLGPLELIALLTVFYIVLGCFLDGISSIVLTMAVIEPLVRQAGFDMIWFGIYLMIVVEMAQITPPIGFNLFVLQGMTGHDMGFIARASLPMFLIMVLAVVLLVWFPEVATYLPSIMNGPG